MAIRRDLNRAFFEAVLLRRGAGALDWEVDVEYNRETITYSSLTTEAYGWIRAVDGFNQQMSIAPNGVTISDSDGTIDFGEDFGAHMAMESIEGKTVSVYRRVRGTDARQMVAYGICLGSVTYDRATGYYSVQVIDYWASFLGQPVPGAVLTETMVGSAPGDSYGRPLQTVFGRLNTVPTLLVGQPGLGHLATYMTPSDTQITVDNDSRGTFPLGGSSCEAAANVDNAQASMTVNNVSGTLPGVGGVGRFPDGEIITYRTTEDLGGGSYLLIDVRRGYAQTVAASHLAGDLITLGYIVSVDPGQDTVEYVFYGERSGANLLNLTRALFGTEAQYHKATADNPALVRVIRGQGYTYLISDSECMNESDATGPGFYWYDCKKRGDEDLLEYIAAEKLVNYADTDTLSDRTITSVTITSGLADVEEQFFSDARRDFTDSDPADGSGIPSVNGLIILPYAGFVGEEGHNWTDADNAADLDVSTKASASRQDTTRWANWKFDGLDSALSADITNVALWIKYHHRSWFRDDNGTGSGVLLQLSVNGNYLGIYPDPYGYGVPDMSYPLPTTTEPDYLRIDLTDLAYFNGDALDWTAMSDFWVLRIRLIIMGDDGFYVFGGSGVAENYECAILITRAADWGWSNIDNAIDSDDGTWADWDNHVDGANHQRDILTLTTPIDSDRSLGSVQVWLKHRENGAAGSWDKLRVRCRTAAAADAESTDCGAWVDIPHNGFALPTEVWLALPLPSGVEDGIGTVYVDIDCQGDATTHMYLYEAKVKIFQDTQLSSTPAPNGVIVAANPGRFTRDDGSYSGTAGTLLENPTYIAKYILRRYGGLSTTLIDGTTWATARDDFDDRNLRLAGIIDTQRSLAEHLQAVLSATMSALNWDGDSLRYWTWPGDTSDVAMQFVASETGPSNVLSVGQYTRDMSQVINDLTLLYRARKYGSERRGVIVGDVSRQPGRYLRAWWERRGEYTYPLLRSYTPGTENDHVAESQRRYGIHSAQVTTDWISEGPTAVALAEEILSIFGFARWRWTALVGSEAELIRVGDMVEWVDSRLPFDCLAKHQTSSWWLGSYFGEDLWPAALPAIYAIVTGVTRNDDETHTISLLEWGDPTA